MNTAKFAGKEILKMFPISLLNIRSSCDNIYCWITGTNQIWWAPVDNAPININPVRGECGQGAGIWCLRLSPCRAFDRAKRPRGRDVWLWPTEAWYQCRSGYQVRPSRLSESHAVGERYEVNNVYFEKGFIFKFPSDCKTRLKSNSTMKVRGFFTGHWSDLFRHV